MQYCCAVLHVAFHVGQTLWALRDVYNFWSGRKRTSKYCVWLWIRTLRWRVIEMYTQSDSPEPSKMCKHLVENAVRVNPPDVAELQPDGLHAISCGARYHCSFVVVIQHVFWCFFFCLRCLSLSLSATARCCIFLQNYRDRG